MVKIYCDLDGTLVDFNRGIIELTGKHPDDIPDKYMWPAVMKDKTFFLNLKWLHDGKDLWNFILPYDPAIITGQPSSFKARNHKKQWCAIELGNHIDVTVCKSKEKYLYGLPGDILIDDRQDVGDLWIDMGGIHIYHEHAKDSIEQLKDLGYGN